MVEMKKVWLNTIAYRKECQKGEIETSQQLP